MRVDATTRAPPVMMRGMRGVKSYARRMRLRYDDMVCHYAARYADVCHVEICRCYA